MTAEPTTSAAGPKSARNPPVPSIAYPMPLPESVVPKVPSPPRCRWRSIE